MLGVPFSVGVNVGCAVFRLVYDEERKWTDANIDMVALKHFPSVDRKVALGRPILYSNWLSKDYIPVDREELREFTRARLKVCFALGLIFM